VSQSIRARLDCELVRRNLAASRAEAGYLVASGLVRVSGAPALKASRLVRREDRLDVIGPPPRYVSRGGEKLAGALAEWGIDPIGITAIDIGASTGGFTDCLLQHGAVRVVALDVGRNQLDPRIATDARVKVVDRCNVRLLANEASGPLGGERFSFVVADLSFISLAAVIPAVMRTLVAPRATLLLLVKPQFEAGRKEVSRGKGVIRDPLQWKGAIQRVISALVAEGAGIMGVMPSPLRGAAGNVEFFVHAVSGGGGARSDEIDSMTAMALSRAVIRQPPVLAVPDDPACDSARRSRDR